VVVAPTAQFVPNAVEIAREVMSQLDAELTEKYASIIRFLALNPERAPLYPKKKKPKGLGSKTKLRKGVSFGSPDYIKKYAKKFAAGRILKPLKVNEKIADRMVSVLLEKFYPKPNEVAKILKGHGICMTLENKVGDLLERYIADILESNGWVWASGSLISAVDFIRPPTAQNDLWHALQIKNSDVSENSSSRAIRDGTDIQAWHRKFSKKPGDNWAAFPETFTQGKFSEEGFEKFVRKYVRAMA
jgi:hypothetical protein